MDALSPLGMVSDNPSEIHTESGAEAQKDYFVEKDGVKFAGTHCCWICGVQATSRIPS